MHGLYALKASIKRGEALDGRTAVGKALLAWRSSLVDDLGGPDVLSTQQSALVDLAVKGKLLLDSVDAWLLSQPRLVNGRKRALIPALRERTSLAAGLERTLATLGLERKAREVESPLEALRREFARPQPRLAQEATDAEPVTEDTQVDAADAPAVAGEAVNETDVNPEGDGH